MNEDEEQDNVLWAVSGQQEDPELSTADAYSDPENPVKKPLEFSDGHGSAFASAVTTYASGNSLSMVSSMRTIGDRSAPTHQFKDRSRGETLAEVQYTWDDADDRARINLIEYPERPHRRRKRTLHPAGSMVTAVASGVGSLTTTYDEWPSLSERHQL